MIEETKKQAFWGGPHTACYRDTDTGLEYRRIFGGMAWPGTQPGFVVIAGEDFEPNKKTGEHQIRILAEYEALNPSDLIRRCSEYEAMLKVENTYGDTSNRPMMDFIYNGKVDLFLSDAPFMDDESKAVNYFLSLIREMTSPAKKVLFFNESSRLPGILAGVDQHSVPPAVLALGYVLAAFKSTSPRDPNAHLLVQPEPVPGF